MNRVCSCSSSRDPVRWDGKRVTKKCTEKCLAFISDQTLNIYRCSRNWFLTHLTTFCPLVFVMFSRQFSCAFAVSGLTKVNFSYLNENILKKQKNCKKNTRKCIVFMSLSCNANKTKHKQLPGNEQQHSIYSIEIK